MSFKIWKLVFLIIVIISTASCGAVKKTNPTPTPLPPLVTYEKSVYTVERGSIEEKQTLLADVAPMKQDELFFRASGFVNRVIVKEGDIVKTGDLLAEQQVDDLLNQLEQARIDLQVVQAALDRDEAQNKYTLARTEHEVKIWEIKVKKAQLDLDNAVTLKEKEKLQLDLDEVKENLELAKLAQQQATEESGTTYQKQAVERSKLAVQRLESLIEERRIIAPYDCVIMKSKLRPGQSVDAFDSQFTVGDPTQLVLRATKDFQLVDRLHKDTPVTMYLSSLEEQGYAIEYLPDFLPISSKEVDSSTTTTTDLFYFSFPLELKDKLVVGRQVKLEILLGREENVLLLPPAAIRNYRGLNFVIVLDGEKKRRVDLYEIGLKTTERWEVVGELSEGDKVLGP